MVKGHKRSPVLPRLIASIVGGSLLRRTHFESLRAAEAKNAATINQLKYRSRSCITGNIALGAWSRALGCVLMLQSGSTASCRFRQQGVLRHRPPTLHPVRLGLRLLTSVRAVYDFRSYNCAPSVVILRVCSS